MATIWLYPGEVNPYNIKLSDPTVQRSGGGGSISGAADLLQAVQTLTASGAIPVNAAVGFVKRQQSDQFQGPPKKQGIIGRLALDRQLSDYGVDILIAISGLSSETLQICGESSGGNILSPTEIQPEKGTTLIPNAIVQNGTFVIHIDDLKPDWDNLAFIKSGSSDPVKITIESLFDYVEIPQPSTVAKVVIPRTGWGLDQWGMMPWGG